jgi:hypothetical protein
MWGSITTKAITKLGPHVVIVLLQKASLTPTYCFKFEVVMTTWPKVRVCLLSNSCCVISSKIEKKSIVPIWSIKHITLVDQVELIKLVTLVNSIDLVEIVKLVGMVDLIDPKIHFWYLNQNSLWGGL